MAIIYVSIAFVIVLLMVFVIVKLRNKKKAIENQKLQEEKERLLKYYKDVPVWNITAWHDVDCREIRYGIEARCHYKDVREGYLAEKADLKRTKERERRKKKREQTEGKDER